jgi:hypothetical protein
LAFYSRELYDYTNAELYKTTDVFIEVKLMFSDGTPICIPKRTKFNDKYQWDEWITFPTPYCELSHETVVC